MSTYERILYTDINFVETLLMRVYLSSNAMAILQLCIYIMLYANNVSIISQYIYIYIYNRENKSAS